MLDPDELRDQVALCQDYVSSNAFPSVVALEKNQLKLSEQIRLNQDKVETLRKEHGTAMKPLYHARDKLLREKSTSSVIELDEDGNEVEVAVEEVGIPGFWLRVLKGCEECDKAIKDRDEEALAHLTVVEWEVKGSGANMIDTLKLYFSDNEFFKNKVLTKEWPDMEGTEIEWKVILVAR